MNRRQDRERGSVTIEAVIVVPALLLFISLIIAVGRVQIAHQIVDAAAAEAARAASLARDPADAQTRASTSGEQALTNYGLGCASSSVNIDTSGFAAPVGTPAYVSATITCVVDLGDVAIPGMPGAITITSTVASPLDTFRER